MEIKIINEKELKILTGQVSLYKDIIEIDQTEFDVLLNSEIISLEQLVKLESNILDNLSYINRYLNLLNIKKIYTQFILEDLKSMVLIPEFDIVVYLNTIMTIQRYKSIYRIVKEQSTLDDRKQLYTKIESCTHSREIDSMLMNMDIALKNTK